MQPKISISKNLLSTIGNTPLLQLDNFIFASGSQIFVKAEHLNPGGSIKDRTALGIISSAIKLGRLKKGMTIYEGTAGNTGIGIAMIASHLGFKCVILIPDNQAEEKYQTLEAYGAKVIKVAPCPFTNPNHFYHLAKKMASEDENGFWVDQFENTDNFKMHYETTGPEIWQQCGHQLDAFVCSAGTGGTLAGVSRFLKEKDPNIQIYLVDPKGSGLYSYLKTGEIKSEGTSITEGIGIMRITQNFLQTTVNGKSIISDALQFEDQQILNMVYMMAQHHGLLVGTSAALNICAAKELAERLQNKKIVTIIPDSALRYQSKLFNKEWLNSKGLHHPDCNKMLLQITN